METHADLQARRCLFLSYFYPPIAGAGLPGAMRSVKFIRNLNNFEIHVLTVEPGCYNRPAKFDYDITLPIKQEAIYRSKILDIFGYLLKLRLRLKHMRTGGKEPDVTRNKAFASAEASDATAHTADRPGLAQRFKDFLYNLHYFPDQTSPWIPYALFRGIGIIRRHKIEVIFATGMPWSALLTGYLLSLLTGLPLIVDFRDPWVNNPFYFSKGKFLDGLAKWMERRIVSRATFVSLNTEPLREEFVARYPDLPTTKMIFLPNGYDESDFKGLEDAHKSRNGSNELVLCHAGFLYGLRDPAPLLDALLLCRERLVGSGKRIRFVQIGQVSIGYNLADKYGGLLADGTLDLRDNMPYRTCLRAMAASDVLVNVQPGTHTQIPSKLYDYLGLNRPIINLTVRDGALWRIVAQHGFGDLFDSTQEKEIADRLISLLQEKTRGPLLADYPDRDRFEIKAISENLAACLNTAASNGKYYSPPKKTG